MAQFDFQCPKTGRVITIHQSVHEPHEYVDGEGIKWQRLFSVPNAVVSSLSNLDPKDPKAFVKATKEKRGSVGNLFDLSAELSEKRASKNGGMDEVKLKSWEKYESKRVKSVHPDRKKQQMKEFAKANKAFDIEI